MKITTMRGIALRKPRRELDIQLVDAGLWSKVPPKPEELRNVVRLIAAAPRRC